MIFAFLSLEFWGIIHQSNRLEEAVRLMQWSGCLATLEKALQPLQVLSTADIDHEIDYRRFPLFATSAHNSLIGYSSWNLDRRVVQLP